MERDNWATSTLGFVDWTDIVFEGIGRFVPHKILKQNPDAEYYNKDVKRLKRRVRKAYNMRKLGADYKAKLKRLSSKLLSAKRNALDNFLSFILQNESKVQTGCDGTRAETRFGLPAKRTSPFISAGLSVQSSTDFLGVRVGRERL